mgnify:CR=1 FL=1
MTADAKLAEYVGTMNLTVHYDSGPLISVSAAGEGTAVHAVGHPFAERFAEPRFREELGAYLSARMAEHAQALR